VPLTSQPSASFRRPSLELPGPHANGPRQSIEHPQALLRRACLGRMDSRRSSEAPTWTGSGVLAVPAGYRAQAARSTWCSQQAAQTHSGVDGSVSVLARDPHVTSCCDLDGPVHSEHPLTRRRASERRR
jgi:hypothetical protein